MVFDLAQELIDEDYHRSDVISARYGDLPKPPLQRVSNSIARPKLDVKMELIMLIMIIVIIIIIIIIMIISLFQVLESIYNGI